jgi:prolyl-tRNA synthetase
MRQSHLFTKTRREAPKDEVAKNAQLLIRAGFVHKEMAGVYSYLPLGLRVLNRVNAIIREEMNALGAQEVFLSSLQEPGLWEKTGRWSDEAVDSWFKTNLKNGTTLGLGFTHEEPLTNAMRDHIRSYRDLPAYAYQIQKKFRNEARAKSGLMRGREFLMKDLYSFARSEEEHQEFYERAKAAYKAVFNRVGLGARTYLTFASGGSFSKFSHEFQTLSDAGEDTIYVDAEKGIAVNREVFEDGVLAELGLSRESLVEERAVEVGNIFSLGTRFSDALDLTFLDESGTRTPVVMGSYGIGPDRLVGTVVETLADERGIVWPKEVAPFAVHLIDLSQGDAALRESAENLYRELQGAGIETLYDDRDARAGEKFADADLIGIPTRVTVGARAGNGNVEVAERTGGEPRVISVDTFIKSCAA